MLILSKILGTRNINNLRLRGKLKDKKPFTVFSNNCIGGVFTHDLGFRFNSPTVNLTLEGPDFIKFLKAPKDYISGEFIQISKEGFKCPCAKLNDIVIDFVHYKSVSEGANKWEERAKRIVWDNIIVIATGHYGVEEHPQIMEEFDKLPYRKIMFTLNPWPKYDWAVHVPGLLRCDPVPPMTGIYTLSGKRVYEKYFDLVEWMNSFEK